MILLAVFLLGVGVIVASGRTISPLAQVRFRAVWVAGTALAVQVLILGVAPGGSRPLHAVLHVATYALAGWFAFANRKLPGVVLAGAGGALNALAIVVNGGVMPASRSAMTAAGMQPTGGFENSAVVANPHLSWLGDILPVPGPLRNVLSVGDLVIMTGALLFVVRASAPRMRAASGHVGGLALGSAGREDSVGKTGRRGEP